MYSRITVTVEMKAAVYKKDVAYRLSQFLGFAQLKVPELKALHASNLIKPFVYDGLYPFEADGTVKKGRLYSFHIKTPFVELAQMFTAAIPLTESPFFKVIHASLDHFEDSANIKALKTVTPVSSFIDNAPWTKDKGILSLADAIVKNTAHKYQLVYNTLIPHENWLQGIQVLSDKPIVTHYKCKKKGRESCPYNSRRCNAPCSAYTPIGILGYKVQIELSQDPCGNAVGNLLLGTGILEKNAILGMGYTERV